MRMTNSLAFAVGSVLGLSLLACGSQPQPGTMTGADAATDANTQNDGTTTTPDSSSALDSTSALDTATQDVATDVSSATDGAQEGGGPDVTQDASSMDATDGASDAADGSMDAGNDADVSTSTLNPNVAPGGNFDLSLWELQEPIGTPGSPTVIPPAQLIGPNGFHDSYFFTDTTDGSMTFWDPENGVTTPNANYARCMLREMAAGGGTANWPAAGTNLLSGTLEVTQVPDHVSVAEIHIGTGTPASNKPLGDLFAYADGSLVLSVEPSPAGGNAIANPVGNVPLGTRWSYVLGLSGATLSISINGGTTQTFTVPITFTLENFFFNAGDYDQTAGTDGTVGAKVKYYALGVVHQ
jgi:hypothetical protein